MHNQCAHRLVAGNSRHWYSFSAGTLSAVTLIIMVGLLHPSSFNGTTLQMREAVAATLSGPSRSTNIALTQDDRRLVVVNRETNSVSIIRVRNAQGNDVTNKIAEITVGIEPRCVAVSPDDDEAFVTNGISGTVSVINLNQRRVVAEIRDPLLGPELRGCALTPNGTLLFVANHTAGTVAIIRTASRTVIGTVSLPPQAGDPTPNPFAIAITNNGDDNDLDETVFVTQFFAELISGGPGEGFDTGKQGVVYAFPATANPSPVTRILLPPLSDTGFTADRTAFCPPNTQNTIFCPNVPDVTKTPQGCFPNQLHAALIRDDRLWLPNICAQPEPPVQFTVNIQAVVHSVNTGVLSEVEGERINLNEQLRLEQPPLFGGDIVAIDATLDRSVFLIVSRNNDFAVRATLDANNRFDLNAPDIIRFRTGHIPTGVVISYDGTRAYTNNDVDVSVTRIDLQTNTIISPDVSSGTPPAPGTVDHVVLLGKLVFFTGLGVPDDDSIFGTDIRQIDTLANRGKASNNGWSSCGSCHPDGLSDHVTWIFPAGPRSTTPLDATFDKHNPLNTRINLWSALRDGNVDFNNNSRGVQGGIGWAGNPPNPNIYDHGIQEGVPPLDALTTWVQVAVRAPLQPQLSNTAALINGRTVFANACASCHGGPKWTKSQIFYEFNPSFDNDPALGGQPIDPGIANAGAQIISLTRVVDALGPITLKYLENVGTFNSANPIEIRGQGAASGQLALGGLGFNVPALLGIAYHAPYLHNGAAQNLAGVFTLHTLPQFGNQTIADVVGANQGDLLLFLNSIDGRTPAFRSQAEDFRDCLALPGPCTPPGP